MKSNTPFRAVKALIVLSSVLIILTLCTIQVRATTYTWTGSTSTDWFTSTNWTASSGSSYPHSSTDTISISTATNQPSLAVTGSTGSTSVGPITINSGTLTVSVVNGYTLSTKDITINNGGTLTISSTGGGMYVNNNLTVNNGGALSNSGTGLQITTNMVLNSGSVTTLNASSTTVIYGALSGSGTLTAAASSAVDFNGTCSLGSYTFGNLVLNSLGNVTLTGDIVVQGSISGNGKLNPASYNISVGSGISVATLYTGTGSSAITITGSIAWANTSYTFNNLIVNGTSTNGLLTINGNLSGTGTFNLGNGHTLSIGGNISVANFLGNNGTGSTVTLNGTSQTISSATSAVFSNLVVNSSTGATFTVNPTINGNLSGTGTLTGGSSTITVGGTFSVSHFTTNSSTVILTGTSNLGSYTFNKLTINTGTVTLTGDLVVNSDLTGTGTLTPSSYNVTVGGNTTIANMTAGTGSSTTTLNGASQGVNAQTFNNLTINCSSGATLNGNITVNGTLHFSSGLLYLGTYKLTIGTSGSMTGFSSSSYIYTKGGGTLEMTVTTSGATFSIGDDYNPITIMPLSGTAIYDIAVDNGVTDASNAAITSHAVNVTWTITVTSGSQSVTVIPQWDGTAELTGFDRNNCYIATRTSLTDPWVPTSGSSGASGSDPYTQTSGSFTITAGNTYYIGIGDNASALPVTFTSFTVINADGSAALAWATASEINNNYFGVERSDDGNTWRTIAQVPGHGNSKVTERYSYTDKLQGIVPAEHIYYRLRQVDYNGNYEYSQIRVINTGANAMGLELYPNPAGDLLNVTWTNNTCSDTKLTLTNANGSVVYTEIICGAGEKNRCIDISAYPAGIFYLQIVNGSEVICRQVIKQ